MGSLRAYSPCGIEASADYTVTVTHESEIKQVGCHHAVVGNRFRDYSMSYEKMSFCSFDCDFTSPVVISVKPSREWREAVIRPKSAGIKSESTDGAITFTIDKPAKLSVEFDGDLYHNLFIFADYPDAVPASENVRYYSAGAYDVGNLVLRDGERLHIDGDAVLFGNISVRGNDVKISGRGIISGEKMNHDCEMHREQLFNAKDSDNLSVEGVIFLDSPAWTFVTVNCRNVSVNNIKQICYNPNSDGFDICGCTDMTVDGCFVRNFDDNVSLKSFGADNVNITVKNTVMWADCAHNMLVGPESKPDTENKFRHILFENIDVLEHKEYSEFFMGVMAIFCADKAEFSDIEWNNIRVERMTYGRLFDFNYVDAFASTYGKFVRDVRMKNIECEAPVLFRSRIRGLDSEHTVDGVKIEGFRIHGIPVTAGEPSFEIADFTENITIE